MTLQALVCKVMFKKFLALPCLLLLTFSATTCVQGPRAVDAITAKDGKANAALFLDAIDDNIPYDAYGKYTADQLSIIVAAIRYAENGGPGKEYGILHPKCPKSYRAQAGWCAATVFKNFKRYLDSEPMHPLWIEDYIKFLGSRYAPVGADNDPDNLNSNWVRNVTFYYNKFSGGRV